MKSGDLVPSPLAPFSHVPGADAENRKPLPAGYQSVDSIVITEPRIESIRRELQALLEVVDLESSGESVSIDGFRLRDLEHWADYPTSLSDIFWHLSSVCNFNCDFCYEKGNPPDFPIQDVPRMASEQEIQERLRYYDPSRRTGIFSVRSIRNPATVSCESSSISTPMSSLSSSSRKLPSTRYSPSATCS